MIQKIFFQSPRYQSPNPITEKKHPNNVSMALKTFADHLKRLWIITRIYIFILKTCFCRKSQKTCFGNEIPTFCNYLRGASGGPKNIVPSDYSGYFGKVCDIILILRLPYRTLHIG